MSVKRDDCNKDEGCGNCGMGVENLESNEEEDAIRCVLWEDYDIGRD